MCHITYRKKGWYITVTCCVRTLFITQCERWATSPPPHVSEMGPVLWRFLPRPWGGINTNEMAERETLALWLNVQVNEQACRGRSVLSEGTEGFLQTSCEPDSPLSTHGAVYIESRVSRAPRPRRPCRYELSLCRENLQEKNSTPGIKVIIIH